MPVKSSNCTPLAILVLALINSISGAMGQGISEPAPVPPGLIGWWKGDGNAEDSVEQRDAAVTSVSYAPGIVGQAFRFEGTDSSLIVPPEESLRSLTNITLECWVWNDPEKPFGRLITITPEHYVLGFDQAGKLFFSVGYGVVPETSEFYSPKYQTAASGDSVPSSRWVHLAATYDGDIARLYVDGQLVRETHAPRQLENQGQAPAVIINYERAGEVDGLIDEVAVYDHALTHGEIWSHFNAGSAGMAQVPILSRISVSFPGEARLHAVGPVGKPVTIQASRDLLDWTPLFTSPNEFGAFDFADSGAGGFGFRFYRAVQLP